MTDATGTFHQLRPRLQGIAYRMLGSVAESEELVQDVWLRWNDADRDAILSAEAWLVSTTTRLSIDRLRTAQVERRHYSGIWLPEPLITGGPATPEDLLERADDISAAFLLLLERLSPEARAAFLLREVFDADYADVARMIGKTEAASRQMVSRAKAQLREARPRYEISRETHEHLLRGFAEAMNSGDFAALNAMLAEDAELLGDGGGKITAFPKPLAGGRRIAQLYYATKRRLGDGVHHELALVNGQWGVLRYFGGVLESVQSFETDGERIVQIQVQRNPEKLQAVTRSLARTS